MNHPSTGSGLAMEHIVKVKAEVEGVSNEETKAMVGGY